MRMDRKKEEKNCKKEGRKEDIMVIEKYKDHCVRKKKKTLLKKVRISWKKISSNIRFTESIFQSEKWLFNKKKKRKPKEVITFKQTQSCQMSLECIAMTLVST